MITKRFKTAAITFLVAGLLAVSVNMGVAADTPYYQGKTLPSSKEDRRGYRRHKNSNGDKICFEVPPRQSFGCLSVHAWAGGISAVNHLIHRAPRDGLTIGGVSSAIVSSVITGAPSIRFRLEDIRWLGTGSPGTPTGVVVRPGLVSTR